MAVASCGFLQAKQPGMARERETLRCLVEAKRAQPDLVSRLNWLSVARFIVGVHRCPARGVTYHECHGRLKD